MLRTREGSGCRRLTCKYLLAYYDCHGHRPGIQGARRSQPKEAARRAVFEQWADADRTLRASGYGAAGGYPAPGAAGAGQPGRDLPPRAGKIALPQPCARARDLRTLDQEVRTLTSAGAARSQAAARREMT